jgi:hypothetical protein
MDFLQRLTFLLHLAGFLAGVIALPIMVWMFFDGIDLDEGLLTPILFTFLAPLIGWGLRWLIAGELAEFIPFQKNLIDALPKDSNFGATFLLICIFSSLFFYSEEHNSSKDDWENKVFGTQCINKFGDEAILSYFKAPEGAEKGDPIYCSDYLEPKSYSGDTLCTWDDGENAGSWECLQLEDNPKPVLDWSQIVPPIIFINLLVFYFLTLIRLIYNLRTQSS